MTNIQVDMTFEEYKEEFIRMLLNQLKHENPLDLMSYIKKINFEKAYQNAIEDVMEGKSPNLKANISSSVYCYYMCYPDV